MESAPAPMAAEAMSAAAAARAALKAVLGREPTTREVVDLMDNLEEQAAAAAG